LRRFILLLTFALVSLLLAAGSAHAGAAQDGVGDDGTAPAGISEGDENAKGAYAGPIFIELRDIPTTVNGTPSLFGARFMRVTTRVGHDDQYKFIDADFICGDAAVADPCTTQTVCTPGKGSKDVCVDADLVDIRKGAEIQAVVASLIIPRIIASFNLDADTVLAVTKLKKYSQSGPIGDLDGVLSYGAIVEAAYDAQ
jgi:hypothetical protein